MSKPAKRMLGAKQENNTRKRKKGRKTSRGHSWGEEGIEGPTSQEAAHSDSTSRSMEQPLIKVPFYVLF
jgi:hypothetical protein